MLLLIGIFIIVGFVLIWAGRMIVRHENYSIIAGYNSLSNEEKALYGDSIAKEASFFLSVLGILNVISAGCLLFTNFSNSALNDLILIVSIAVFLGFVGFFVLKKKDYPSMSGVLAIPLGLALTIASLLIPYMYYKSVSAPELHITDEMFRIKSMYGIQTSANDITGVYLMDSHINIKRRIEGFWNDDIYRGKFELYNGKVAHLFIDIRETPLIHIVSSKYGDIYLTTKSSDLTTKYYQQIKAIIHSPN